MNKELGENGIIRDTIVAGLGESIPCRYLNSPVITKLEVQVAKDGLRYLMVETLEDWTRAALCNTVFKILGVSRSFWLTMSWLPP